MSKWTDCWGRPVTVKVPVFQLALLSRMACDNPVFCGSGGVCNSCYASGMAKDILAAGGYGPEDIEKVLKISDKELNVRTT